MEAKPAGDAGNRRCAVAETDVPALLAVIRWNRFISWARVSYRHDIFAADHARIPNLDACGSRVSSEAQAGLWTVSVGLGCFRLGPTRQVLL